MSEPGAVERERNLQTPACDRCSVGVMDAENPHLVGGCTCQCHSGVVSQYLLRQVNRELGKIHSFAETLDFARAHDAEDARRLEEAYLRGHSAGVEDGAVIAEQRYIAVIAQATAALHYALGIARQVGLDEEPILAAIDELEGR